MCVWCCLVSLHLFWACFSIRLYVQSVWWASWSLHPNLLHYKEISVDITLVSHSGRRAREGEGRPSEAALGWGWSRTLSTAQRWCGSHHSWRLLPPSPTSCGPSLGKGVVTERQKCLSSAGRPESRCGRWWSSVARWTAPSPVLLNSTTNTSHRDPGRLPYIQCPFLTGWSRFSSGKLDLCVETLRSLCSAFLGISPAEVGRPCALGKCSRARHLSVFLQHCKGQLCHAVRLKDVMWKLQILRR